MSDAKLFCSVRKDIGICFVRLRFCYMPISSAIVFVSSLSLLISHIRR